MATLPTGSYGSRAAKLKRQREYVDALRKQGMETPQAQTVQGTYGPLGGLPSIRVQPSMWDYAAQAVKSGIAGYQGSQLEKEEAALEQQAQQQANEALAGMPSLTKTRKVMQEVPGEQVPITAQQTTPNGEVMPGTMLPQARAQFKQLPSTQREVDETYNVPIEEYAGDLSKFTAGLDATNPYLSGVREYALKQTLEMPEKILTNREKAEERKFVLEQTLQAKKDAAEEAHKNRLAQIEAAAIQGRISREEADQRTAQSRRELAVLTASLRPERAPKEPRMQVINTVDGNGNPIQKVVELTPGASYPAAPSKATGKTGTSSKQDTQAAANKALSIAGVELDLKGNEVKDEISGLIQGSTSGGLQNIAAEAKQFVTGSGTKGQENIGALASKANSITLDLLNGKLGAGISNADVSFLKSTLGDVANPQLGANVRLKAWKAAKERLKKIASGNYSAYAAEGTTGGESSDEELLNKYRGN